MKTFLAKKGVSLSAHTYFVTALSYMALGLFSSLIVGLILKTLGERVEGLAFLTEIGTLAMSLMGPAIGVAIAYGLNAPPLVLFSAVIAGAAGSALGGGPAGSFVASVIAVEVGKMISKETKVDIIVTPFVTVTTGYVVAKFISPKISDVMVNFGELIMWATEQRPFVMGILVAALMGLALTAPISSAAIAIMLGLEGLAAGAATIGCAAQMIGFATSSFRDNGWGGWFAQGLGTSMLQVANIVKKPIILIPPTVAGMLLAPFGTVVWVTSNIPAGAGMGTSGFVGQIMTFESMGFNTHTFMIIALLHFIGPALISLVLSELLRKKGYIQPGDMKIDY
ncbi:PTS transporter subunit IIC [Pseudalkalibacillus berkeleyi]|uniref:PTS sugar transporter subunit IIC n=1 Tax=Pseudalkalibacillus berkeleyi TaxID=1069813 RepID=A0ABS9GZZ2_9BACL|nr:PTS sugar transporter subunit IIC [Pseudalkalibacillus berkeleyi]MCF6138313.1 PTS sugar transporter subunit IIC [Pseudalkalibacillus berkeleyi]